MERDDRAPVAAFFLGEAPPPGTTVALGDDIARHVRALRLGIGARLALLDGQGHRAVGTLVRLSPAPAIEVESLSVTAPPPPVHLMVPIADKDRLMWLAEKSAEHALTSWRPVMYRRSRSVKPRGEGPMFNGRIKARMESALEQSGGHWLPALYPEASLARTIASLPVDGTRLVLDAGGEPARHIPLTAPVTLAVGPEGGLESDEVNELVAAGFVRAALGPTTLRFETAALSALAIARATLT